MSPEMGGDHQMAGVEDSFDDSERPFDQRTDSADSAVFCVYLSWIWDGL